MRKITEINNKSNTNESESEIQIDDGDSVVINEGKHDEPLAARQKERG